MKKILTLFFIVCALTQLSCSPQITWDSPVTLSSTSVDSTDPQVVMDSNGNATAAWLENGVVKASFQPVGMSWGSAQTLSGSGASAPRLAVAGNGDVTAIWLSSTGVVTAARLPFNGTWSSSTAVSAASALTPRLIVDSSGNAVALWNRGGFIESSTRTVALGIWGLAVMLSGANSDNPDLAVSANGSAMAVWHRVVSDQDQIQSASTLIGGTWNAAKTVTAATFMHNYPRVALDANGNATTVWYRSIANGEVFSNIYVMYSLLPSGGNTWDTALPLSEAGMGNPANFTTRVAYDSLGNTYVVWSISYNGSTYNIESAVRQVGKTFTALNAFVSDNTYAFLADAAVNALSDAVVGYMFFDGTDVLIQAVEAQVAGAVVNNYTSAVNLSSGMGNGYPRIASVITGGTDINAAMVWITSDGMQNIIVASNGFTTGVIPPTNPMVTQSSNDFGVFVEYFNTFTWDASTDPNLSFYGLFRNGIFIGAVGSNITEFVDHNAVQNGSVTYGVSAVTNDNAQSAIATVSFP